MSVTLLCGVFPLLSSLSRLCTNTLISLFITYSSISEVSNNSILPSSLRFVNDSLKEPSSLFSIFLLSQKPCPANLLLGISFLSTCMISSLDAKSSLEIFTVLVSSFLIFALSQTPTNSKSSFSLYDLENRLW
jgi:hypothetical protein